MYSIKNLANVFFSCVTMVCAGSAAAQSTTASSGQGFPVKPLRIVTNAPGAASDFASRLIAQGLTESLGQQVIVDNRGNLAGALASKAPPDGYTLVLDGTSFWIGPLLRKTAYDPLRDFSAVALVTSSPNILVVHPSLPVRSVKDLIALATARPGELNYGTGTAGGSPHLAAALFSDMAGVSIVRIPYKGAGLAVNDLISGQVQLMFAIAASVTGHVKSGRLRALAVTGEQPSALFPGLPTVAASGLKGYESVALQGIFAPLKTPAAIIERLNQDIVKYLARADVKEKFFNAGTETVGGTPDQFASKVKSEITRLGKVIRDAGIRDE